MTIVSDQWSGVDISWAPLVMDEEVGYLRYDKARVEHSRFQCDEILDGLCAAYLWLRQHEDFESPENVIRDMYEKLQAFA